MSRPLWVPAETKISAGMSRVTMPAELIEMVQYHYVKMQSSANNIARGLDLWLAQTFKSGSEGGVPWDSAEEMYEIIDKI